MPKRAKKTAVFLIIDDRVQRDTLATKLRAAGFEVHDYMTPREFLIDKRNHSSGVIVTDYRLQGITGLELAEQLTSERATFPFVIMAGHADIPKVIAGNMADTVVKPVATEALTAAIARAQEAEDITDDELHRSFRRLTARELQIVGMVVEGKSSREIGAALGISTKTVEAHRARIMDKTRADDVGHLVRLWRAWKRQAQEGSFPTHHAVDE
jgi:two-component system response regulator FixJ